MVNQWRKGKGRGLADPRRPAANWAALLPAADDKPATQAEGLLRYCSSGCRTVKMKMGREMGGGRDYFLKEKVELPMSVKGRPNGGVQELARCSTGRRPGRALMKGWV